MDNFENEYQKFYNHEIDNVIYQKWKAATEDLDEEGFKREISKFRDFAIEKNCTSILVDMVEFYFAVEPEVQEWMSENIFKSFVKANYTKIAFIVSSDFLTQVSVEQTMNTEGGQQFQNHYFDDVDEALKWLTE